MKETTKAIYRRVNDIKFSTKYYTGNGIDIGSGNDCLYNYSFLFPLIEGVYCWDKKDGDAQYMETISDNSFDFVNSSHCLEHMVDPWEALKNWIRICKVGGYLVITIPDEDLYEQGVFPIIYNKDHKHTFTIYKKYWCDKSINIIDMIMDYNVKVHKIELIDYFYDYTLKEVDQTHYGESESAIEIILQKI